MDVDLVRWQHFCFSFAIFLHRENVPVSAERSFCFGIMILIAFITILQLMSSIDECFTIDVILISFVGMEDINCLSLNRLLHKIRVSAQLVFLPEPIFLRAFRMCSEKSHRAPEVCSCD